jgi:hypothetical protein
MIHYCLLNDACLIASNMQRSYVRIIYVYRIGNDWKDAVVVYFKILSPYFHRRQGKARNIERTVHPASRFQPGTSRTEIGSTNDSSANYERGTTPVR